LRHADDAHELSLQVGQRHQQAWSLSVRALVRASLGNEDGARRDATEALAIAGDRSMGVARIHAVWALGLLELSLDRPDETARVLAPVRRQLIEAGVREPGSMRFVPDEVEAHIALGRLGDAEEPLVWLEEQGQALGRASAVGAAARCRGLIFSASGDLERAYAAFEDALVQTERGPIPFETARTLLAFGSIQRRAKRKSEARATLERARALFEELGAAIWKGKTSAELARIGGRAPSRDELTPSERRVAELVAQGKTNKEVAAALFLSARTVEFHLSRIYRKLGMRSRSELARTFRE
jgi:DNA-binding CsgD family transcriptional regulator